MPTTGRSTKHGCLHAATGVFYLATISLACTGCRTLGSQEPVSKSVAEGRQLTQQGINAMERGDWNRAESLLERAVIASAKDAHARRNYAESLMHRGSPTEALAQLEAARKLAAADPCLTVRTGEIYLAMNKSDEARRLVDEALKLDPKFAPAWALRGRVAGAAGEHRVALADYQRSLGYAPDNYDVAILLAETYRQLNEPDRALVTLQALADRYSPGDEPQQVLHLEGLALVALARYDDAARALSRAAQRERPSADLLCNLAEAELMAGRASHAQHALQQALAANPEHAASRALATRIATATGTIMR